MRYTHPFQTPQYGFKMGLSHRTNFKPKNSTRVLDLDYVLERFIADWLTKAPILQDPSPEKPRPK